MPHRHAIILLILIVIGVLAGVMAGWIWGPAMLKVAWLGDLFLTTLKMLIVPLIIAAVIMANRKDREVNPVDEGPPG